MSLFGRGLNEVELVISGIGDSWEEVPVYEGPFSIYGSLIHQIGLSSLEFKQIKVTEQKILEFGAEPLSQINLKEVPDWKQINLEQEILNQINVSKPLNTEVNQINIEEEGPEVPAYFQGETVSKRYLITDKNNLPMNPDTISAKFISPTGVQVGNDVNLDKIVDGEYELNYTISSSGLTGTWIIFLTVTKTPFVEKTIDTIEVVQSR